MALVNYKDIRAEIHNQIHAIDEAIENEWIDPEVNGLVSVVFLAQVSARKWCVSWCCTPRTTKPTETVNVPHPEEYQSNVEATAIFVDGYWEVAPIVFA